MRIFANRQVVPVLMFHSLGLRGHPWCWAHLSESVEAFDEFLGRLVARGFRAIGLDELQSHMRGETADLKDAIVLTFDDGYLDNWVYAAPLLRRHGLRGTVFVSPEFVDPSSGLRPTLDDVWSGRVGTDELQPAGFMNWDELRALDKEGVLDVQSHAMTHTWHFAGPRIVGWHRGERLSPWPWLAWNSRPDRKPYYLNEDQAGYVPVGHPVFEYEPALVARRFMPDESLVGEIVRHVSTNPAFVDGDRGQEELRRLVNDLAGTSFPGTWETEDEHEQRVRHELGASREIIGTALGKSVDYVCWPNGGYDNLCERLALELGYRAWTLGSTRQTSVRNVPGASPTEIRRMGGAREMWFRGRSLGEGSVTSLIHRVEAHRGSLVHYGIVGVRKLAAAARPVLGGVASASVEGRGD